MEAQVPVYYVVSRGLTDERVALMQHILSITPISHALITDIYDAEMAFKFSQVVMKLTSFDRAKEEAARSGTPVIIIGDVPFVVAYYEDGTSETLSC